MLLHVTTDTPAPSARINADALHAARMLERIRAPLRIYITSTGSSAGELTQTSTHLRVHVIPLFDDLDRLADVFSWQAGALIGRRCDGDRWGIGVTNQAGPDPPGRRSCRNGRESEKPACLSARARETGRECAPSW